MIPTANISNPRLRRHLQNYLDGRNMIDADYVASSIIPRQGEEVVWNVDRLRKENYTDNRLRVFFSVKGGEIVFKD